MKFVQTRMKIEWQINSFNFKWQYSIFERQLTNHCIFMPWLDKKFEDIQ